MNSDLIFSAKGSNSFFSYNRSCCRFFFFLLLLFLFTGCAAFEDDTSYHIQQQIERQQVKQELAAETVPEQKKSADEYEAIGDRYLAGGDVNRAYIYYLKGLGVEPENVSLRRKQGTLLLKKKKFVEAEKIFSYLLDRSSDDVMALEGRGKAYFGQGRIPEAEKAFTEVINIKSDQYQSYEFLGLIKSRQGEYNQAINNFKAALAYQPLNEHIRNNLALTYYLNGDFKDAVQLFQQLAASSTNKKIHNNLALAYFRLGLYEEAMAAFKRGSDNEAVAYNNMGYEFLSTKKYRDAVKAFEKAIDLYPRFYPSAQKNLDIARNELAKITLQQN